MTASGRGTSLRPARPLGGWALPGAELVLGALIGEVAGLAALIAAGLVLVNPAADEFGGTAVVGGDGGGEGALVEELAVHLGDSAAGVVGRDEEDEGDAAAAAGEAVLEDGDLADLAEGGEDGVDVGVGEGVVQIANVDSRFRWGQASAAVGSGLGVCSR